jgi:hypothetical protein
MLRSITMPTKNFFLSPSLAPTCSSCYPFLYTARKRPLLDYVTSTSLNCTSLDYCPATGMLLNCTILFSNPASGTMLNCNLAQTSHDMPSSHVGHVGHLRHWTYCGTPSGPYIILRHLRQLGHPGHPGHLGHLSHLGNIGDLNPLDPSPLDPTPTDSLPGAFITEMDPMDPGPSEGCYADDSLNPLHPETSLETVTQVRHP